MTHYTAQTDHQHFTTALHWPVSNTLTLHCTKRSPTPANERGLRFQRNLLARPGLVRRCTLHSPAPANRVDNSFGGERCPLQRFSCVRLLERWAGFGKRPDASGGRWSRKTWSPTGFRRRSLGQNSAAQVFSGRGARWHEARSKVASFWPFCLSLSGTQPHFLREPRMSVNAQWIPARGSACVPLGTAEHLLPGLQRLHFSELYRVPTARRLVHVTLGQQNSQQIRAIVRLISIHSGNTLRNRTALERNGVYLVKLRLQLTSRVLLLVWQHVVCGLIGQKHREARKMGKWEQKQENRTTR